MTKYPKVLFFGSGPVAAASLQALYKSFDIVQVVTKTRKGSHPAPVEDVASAHQTDIVYANNRLEAKALVSSGKLIKTTVGIIVDYGVILDTEVINYFELGIINSHFSLLPKLRGADPITFSILEGLSMTGVTLMKIVEKLDEGDILAQEDLVISNSDTTPTLTDKLVALSSKMLSIELPKYMNGEKMLTPQDLNMGETYTRKLTKEDGAIDWQKPAQVIEREVRAYSGWPGSYFENNGQRYVVTSANASTERVSSIAGTVVASADTLGIQTSDGVVWVTSIQPAGKKEMPVKAFLNGYKSKLT